MKVGDMVSCWDDGRGPIGVVLELMSDFSARIRVAKILVDGREKEFNVEELWVFYESR